MTKLIIAILLISLYSYLVVEYDEKTRKKNFKHYKFIK